MDETQALKYAIEIAKMPIEVIKVPLSGGSMVFQMTMSGAYGLQAISQFAQMYQQKMAFEKSVGGSDLETLLKVSGGDIQLAQVPQDRIQELHEAFVQFEIPHASAPDINPDDGFGELMFPTNATPRVNLILEKLGIGSIISPEEYIENADAETLAQLIPEVPSSEQQTYDPEAPTTKLTAQMNPEQIIETNISMEQRRLMEHSSIESLMRNPDKQAFSINIQSLCESQDATTILTRIPATSTYVRFSKQDAFIKDNGQTLLVFEDKAKTVDILNNQNEVIGSVSFAELHHRYFDRVSKLSRNQINKSKPVMAHTNMPGGGL